MLFQSIGDGKFAKKLSKLLQQKLVHERWWETGEDDPGFFFVGFPKALFSGVNWLLDLLVFGEGIPTGTPISQLGCYVGVI